MADYDIGGLPSLFPATLYRMTGSDCGVQNADQISGSSRYFRRLRAHRVLLFTHLLLTISAGSVNVPETLVATICHKRVNAVLSTELRL